MFNRRQFNGAGLSLFGLVAAGATSALSETAARAKEFEIMKSDDEWKKTLTREQYNVLRGHGTERAGSSPLDKTYAPGVYKCAACGEPLYASETKFDSGTGWPSFYAPIDNQVETSTDYKLIFPRTEVHCRKCGGHLGHVFDDGPNPTGKRYCMNGVAMNFEPKE